MPPCLPPGRRPPSRPARAAHRTTRMQLGTPGAPSLPRPAAPCPRLDRQGRPCPVSRLNVGSPATPKGCTGVHLALSGRLGCHNALRRLAPLANNPHGGAGRPPFANPASTGHFLYPC
nr:hypothetical protein Iba_chr06dCG10760 [Ipomoea batatas]